MRQEKRLRPGKRTYVFIFDMCGIMEFEYDKEMSEWNIIRFNQTLENRTAVVVKGIILFENKALIVKRAECDDISPGAWENVGGNIEFGEGLESALKREIKEEAGIQVTIERLLFAITLKTDPTRQVVILCCMLQRTTYLRAKTSKR